MINPVQFRKYLREMARWVHPRKLRWGAYREIRHHLLCKYDDFIDKGCTPEEAIDKVMLGATAPKVLGKKIHNSRRSPLFRYPVLVFGGLVPLGCLLFISIGSHVYYNQYFLPSYQQKFQLSAILADKFEADLKLLEKKPLFDDSEKRHNASAFFTHRELLSSEAVGSAMIWEQMKALKKLDFAGSWSKKKEDTPEYREAIAMDFSWLEQLYDYDHWNTLVHTYKKPKWRKSHFSFHLPISNFNFVQKAIVLYAVKKINNGEFEQAQRMLRHGAELLYSTHSLEGQKEALWLVKMGSFFAHKHGLPDQDFFLEDSLQAYRRVSQVWAGIFQEAYFNPNKMDRWRPYLKKGLGVCSAVRELPISISHMNDFFGGNFPLEPNFENSLRRSKKLSKDLLRECDLRGLFENQSSNEYRMSDDWDAAAWEVHWKYGYWNHKPIRSGFHRLFPDLKSIPFIRRMVGLYLVNLNPSSSKDAYDLASNKSF